MAEAGASGQGHGGVGRILPALAGGDGPHGRERIMTEAEGRVGRPTLARQLEDPLHVIGILPAHPARSWVGPAGTHRPHGEDYLAWAGRKYAGLGVVFGRDWHAPVDCMPSEQPPEGQRAEFVRRMRKAGEALES